MNKLQRSILCILLTLVILTGMGSGVFAWMYDTYDDVQRGSWYYEAVMEISNMGVMNGVRAHVFAPHQTLTRAMAVTILYRLERSPNTTELEQPFTDVKPGAYYEKAVRWAYANGITNGVSATHFAPDDLVTREQFACMIVRFGQAFNKSHFVEHCGVGSFCPNDIDDCSSWAKTLFLVACECKLFRGDGNDYCHPRAYMTRAEAAQVLSNFLDYLSVKF